MLPKTDGFRMTSSSSSGDEDGDGGADPLRIMLSNDSSSGDERRRRLARRVTAPEADEAAVPMDIEEEEELPPPKVALPSMMLLSTTRDEASERALMAQRKAAHEKLDKHEADRAADAQDVASVLGKRWEQVASERGKHVERPRSPSPPAPAPKRKAERKKKKETASPPPKKRGRKKKKKKTAASSGNGGLVPAIADINVDALDAPVDASLVLKAAADFESAALKRHFVPEDDGAVAEAAMMMTDGEGGNSGKKKRKKKTAAKSDGAPKKKREHPNKVDPTTPPVKLYLGDFARLMVCNLIWRGEGKPKPSQHEIVMLEMIMATAKSYVEAGKALQQRFMAALRKIAAAAGNTALGALLDALENYPEVRIQPTVRAAPTEMTVDVWTGHRLTDPKELCKMSSIVINSAKTSEEPCAVIISKNPATLMAFAHYLSFFHEYSHKFMELTLLTDPDDDDEARASNPVYQLTHDMNFEEAWATLVGETHAKRTNTLSWFKSGNSVTKFSKAVCRVRELNENALILTCMLEESAAKLPDAAAAAMDGK